MTKRKSFMSLGKNSAHLRFTNKEGRKPKRYCPYDYRHTDGELFSCVKCTLEECRAARDEWLEGKAE